MKKIFKIVAILCVLGALFTMLFACGNKKTDENGAENFNGVVYNSTKDFSGEQGYKNWYYLTARDSLDKTDYMTWDSEMCTWRTKDINCLIEPHIIHPAQLDQVIRAWKAPQDGRIVITTILQRRPVNKNGVGQDGCYAYIALNDDDVLNEKIVDATDLEYHYINASAEVKKGQFVYFVFNCNGNYTFDQTYWDLTVKYSDEEV